MVFARAVEGFPEDQIYSVSLISEDAHEKMVGMWFSETATPEARLTRTPTTDGQKLTFSAVHNRTNYSYSYFPVPWDELAIVLSDGMNESSLYPPAGFLHENSGSARPLGEFLLGALAVTCHSTDLNGDGYVNSGDSLTLVALDSGGSRLLYRPFVRSSTLRNPR
ncbi:MAG: hypothetical protein ACUVT7_08560 [Thermoplasmata archaeon]